MPATSPRRPTRPWSRPRGSGAPQDPADLGTAFGMEMALDQDVADPVRPDGKARLSAASLPGWFAKLVRRTGR